jgi:papilin
VITKVATPAPTPAAPVAVQCETVPSAGPCDAVFRKFFFNKRTGSCEEYQWGGCDEAKVNSFDTKELCEAKCSPSTWPPRPANCPAFRCAQPQCRIAPCVSGNRECPARPLIEREGGTCCPGCSCDPLWIDSKNETVKCEKDLTTPPPPPPPFEKCVTVPSAGPCRAAITRFFFDVKSKTCQKYSWGGCEEQTGNSFETEAQCQTQCGAPTKPECPLFKCAAINCKIAPCAEGNRACPASPTIEREGGICCPACDCSPLWLNKNGQQQKCELDGNPCSGPAVVGSCRGAFPSFFFNEKTKKCESFVFGGCGGSANRHGTQAECEAKCIPRTPAPTRDNDSAGASVVAVALLALLAAATATAL